MIISDLPLTIIIVCLFLVLLAILVVNILTLRVLKSFQPPVEKDPPPYKEPLDSLSFHDLRNE